MRASIQPEDIKFVTLTNNLALPYRHPGYRVAIGNAFFWRFYVLFSSVRKVGWLGWLVMKVLAPLVVAHYGEG